MSVAETTIVRPAGAAAIEEAAKLLRRGELVAFPTETVYGLGANALDDRAVAAIYVAKGRPRFNPLIVHIPSVADAERYVEMSNAARILAAAFWPGALTLVLPRRTGCPLSALVSAGLNTVAIRVPSHPVAMALLKAARLPLAAPSANPSGCVSATTAAHVAEGFGEKIAMVLDGGATPLGIESTVIGFDGDKPILLRPGAILRQDIKQFVGPLAAPDISKVQSPGQFESHYAPHASVRLNATTAVPDEALLAFGPDVPPGAKLALNLSPSGNLQDAAANLFAMLRALDKTGTKKIAVMPIPPHGLGEAINDRLQRAAAPRDNGT